jgi:hypothetical protein
MAYTNIDDPSAFFQTVLYTGNSSTQTVTNDGNSDLKPDLVWTKCRSGASHHTNVDSSRGAGRQIYPNLAYQEEIVSGVSGFLTDGFTLGSNGTANLSGSTYVAWQWKANGGTTSSNTDGTITSTVQANTDAGFSIVTYTGNGIASTIGHGLGVVPAMIIVKCRNAGSTNWTVYHKNLNATPQNYILELNNTNAAADNDRFNDTAPTSSVFSVNAGSSPVNQNTNTYVAYCFAEKQGYSKFGSYIANANTNGAFVYLGFKPAFIIFKNTQQTTNWAMYDVKRDSFNVATNELQPNTTAAANDDIPYSQIDILSNGIKMRNNNGLHTNAFNGQKIIYMAFAENPFVTSTGIPTTAR